MVMIMEIEIIGPEADKACFDVVRNVKEATGYLRVKAEVKRTVESGAGHYPVVKINGKVKSEGVTPDTRQILVWITTLLAENTL